MPRGMIPAVVLALAACSRRAPIASCDDDLRGVYAAGAERWMVLDHGETLEAYPLFPDADGPAELVVAPRMIELARAADAVPISEPGAVGPARSPAPGQAEPTLAGTLHRRYMWRDQVCEARVPVRVTRCAGDTLELVLADPAPPIGFAPCAWPRPGSSRRVRWQRS